MVKGKFIWISLFFLFSPLLCSALVIEPTSTPQFFIASVFLGVAIVFLLKRKQEMVFPNPGLLIAFLVFYAVYLATIADSLNKADAIYESQKVFLGITALIIFLTFFHSPENELELFRAMVIASLAYCLFSLNELAAHGLSDLSGRDVFFSLAGHKNLISSFVFLTLPFSSFGALKFQGSWRVLAISSVLLSLAVIGFLQTRSVYLAVGVSGVVFVILFFTSSWKKRNRILLISAFLIAGIVLASVLLKNAATSVASSNNASLHERYQLWDNTFQLIEENPFLGVGAGNWQYNYSKFSVANIESALHYQTVFKNPHNDFLSVASETGMIGFAIFLLILVMLTKDVLKKIFDEKNLKLVLIFSALAGLMTDAFFSFPKDRIAHVLLIALLLSLLIKLTGSVKTGKSRAYGISILFLAGLMVNAFIGWKRMSGEYHTRRLWEAQANQNPRAVIENGYKAMSVFYSTDPTCTPIYTYIGWGYEALGNTDSLLVVNEAAYALSPFDYKILSNYGYALERKHQVNTAEKVLLEAFRINPNYEPTLLNLSVLEYNRGNYKASLNWLQRIGNYEKKYSGNLQRILEKLAE